MIIINLFEIELKIDTNIYDSIIGITIIIIIKLHTVIVMMKVNKDSLMNGVIIIMTSIIMIRFISMIITIFAIKIVDKRIIIEIIAIIIESTVIFITMVITRDLIIESRMDASKNGPTFTAITTMISLIIANTINFIFIILIIAIDTRLITIKVTHTMTIKIRIDTQFMDNDKQYLVIQSHMD